ncbi:vestitone reductase-like isoform X2 [Apium graveolens]
MRLLQHGYAVNTTVRFHPDKKKDLSYLTNLPGASERLRIFNADLNRPESFNESIQGCFGVFHAAHNIDFEGKDDEETNTKRSINATLSILQACVDSKTVRRVVYTASLAALSFSGKNLDVVDETTWTDVDFLRSLKIYGEPYYIAKTLTERAALQFAETHDLELITVIPTFIHGSFITPHCPGSVSSSMSVIFGDELPFEFPACIPFVHTDDVASAHIFLLENPSARGRYICSAVDVTLDELNRFLSERYAAYNVSSTSFQKNEHSKISRVSSKKLLDAGFKYKYGLEQMYDDAIECCKQKGLL